MAHVAFEGAGGWKLKIETEKQEEDDGNNWSEANTSRGVAGEEL